MDKVRKTILALLIMLLIPTSVFAHRPIFVGDAGASFETAIKIPDPEVSWAIYSALEKPTQAVYFTFEAKQSLPLYAQLLVPKIDRLADFSPAVALVGPDLPATGSQLPSELPTGMGALVFDYKNTDEPEEFYEPFTQTSYWLHQDLRVGLPPGGTYYLVVYDRGGSTGKYVLTVGEREEFGPGDLLSFPTTWWRVHWWYGHGPYLVLFAVAFIAAVLFGAGFLIKRRRKAT